MTLPFVRHEPSIPTRATTLLVLLLALSPGCTFFDRKPTLPKHASIEGAPTPSGVTNFAELVADADIIYFPAERATSGAHSEPSALLLEALQHSGTAFAIGWDMADVCQQPLFDELATATGNAREELVRRLDLTGTGRAREHCRAVLRDARLANVPHLALRCPPLVLERLETGGRLTPEEEKLFPEGYAPPPGGYEAYAERRLSNREGAASSAGSFRAQLASQQFIAERIVGHVRAAGARGKLLVFLRGSDLEAGLGVPHYVAQKVRVRQLVLDSNADPLRTKLLTLQDRIGRTFQIVDRAPLSSFQ